MDVDRAKQQDLGRRAGREGLRDRLSPSDGGDLILTQSNVLPKECLKVRIRLGRAGQCGRGKEGQQYGSGDNTSGHGYFITADYTALRMARPFQLLFGNTQDDLAACVARLTEFVGPPGIRKRQDGFNHGFQFPGILEPSHGCALLSCFPFQTSPWPGLGCDG
jgi:hypothetical protein